MFEYCIRSNKFKQKKTPDNTINSSVSLCDAVDDAETDVAVANGVSVTGCNTKVVALLMTAFEIIAINDDSSVI